MKTYAYFPFQQLRSFSRHSKRSRGARVSTCDMRQPCRRRESDAKPTASGGRAQHGGLHFRVKTYIARARARICVFTSHKEHVVREVFSLSFAHKNNKRLCAVHVRSFILRDKRSKQTHHNRAPAVDCSSQRCSPASHETSPCLFFCLLPVVIALPLFFSSLLPGGERLYG